MKYLMPLVPIGTFAIVAAFYLIADFFAGIFDFRGIPHGNQRSR